MAERRFSEKETALILKTAALIQAEAAQERDAPVSGYSRSELEDAAKDVGMNPQLLGQAITELGLGGEPASGGHSGPLRAFLGSPWSYLVELPLDALPDRATLENLLLRMNEICRTAGAGAIGSIGLSWDMHDLKGTSTGLRMSVRIRTEAAGGASISVSADLRSVGGGIFGGLGGGIGIGAGLGLGVPLLFSAALPFVGPVVMAGSFGASYLLSRAIFGRQSRKCDAATRRIAQGIREFIAKRP